MVEKYDVVENRETGENAWRIASGNYTGIIFNFKNIKVILFYFYFLKSKSFLRKL